MAKNQAKIKQHPEAELLLSENHPLSSSSLSSKNNTTYFKKCRKNKGVCFTKIIRFITMKMKRKKKNRSHNIYYINRPRPLNGHKYNKYKKCTYSSQAYCNYFEKKYKCQLSTVPLLNFRNGSSNILTHFDSLIFQLVNIFGKMYQSLLMSI